MMNFSMSGEVLGPQTPIVEIIQSPRLSISETSIEIIEPKQSITAGKGSDTSRISGTYEVNEAD
jgi:hypothetical protein